GVSADERDRPAGQPRRKHVNAFGLLSGGPQCCSASPRRRSTARAPVAPEIMKWPASAVPLGASVRFVLDGNQRAGRVFRRRGKAHAGRARLENSNADTVMFVLSCAKLIYTAPSEPPENDGTGRLRATKPPV